MSLLKPSEVRSNQSTLKILQNLSQRNMALNFLHFPFNQQQLVQQIPPADVSSLYYRCKDEEEHSSKQIDRSRALSSNENQTHQPRSETLSSCSDDLSRNAACNSHKSEEFKLSGNASVSMALREILASDHSQRDSATDNDTTVAASILLSLLR